MSSLTSLLAAAAAAVAAWVYLMVGHGGYWRTGQRLPSGGQRGRAPRWPAVVAVIPARDEAGVLPGTLPALLAQNYPGPFSVVLVDDRSTDGTAATAQALGRAARRPVRVVTGEPGGAGWAGKVWAMEQGVRAAGPGEYILFTDADIAYEQGTLASLVMAAETGERDLVSQMALLRAETAWERALVPAFVYFFAQLYPFRRVSRPGRRTAAAAGGCMLVRREAFAAAGGLARIRNALIDDVALGRLIKRRPGGGRTWLGFTTRVISRRAYPRLADLWAMVTRSAYHQLHYSPLLLAATILGLAWLYAIPPAAAVAGGLAAAAGGGAAAAWCAAAGAAGWLIMAVTYVPVLRLYRLSPLRALALPLIAAVYAAMTADSARRHWAGHGVMWKGRAVGAMGRRAAAQGASNDDP